MKIIISLFFLTAFLLCETLTHAAWLDAKKYNKGILNDATLGEASFDVRTSGDGLIVASGVWSINNNITIDVPIEIMPGASLYIASGKTVNIKGPFSAGMYKIFGGSGNIVFNPGTTSKIYPEWFGAAGDGSSAKATANRHAIQNAIDSAGSTKIPIIFSSSASAYVIDSKIIIPSKVTIQGPHGGQYAYIKTSPAYADSTMFHLFGGASSETNNITIQDIYFEGVQNTGLSAITADPTVIVTVSSFKHLSFSTDYGMNLGVYTQENIYDDLSIWRGNQLINNKGNINQYNRLRLTGIGTSAFTDPAIYIHDSQGGSINLMHVEFVNPQSRTSFIKFNNVSNMVVDSVWTESWNNNGVMFWMNNCSNVTLRGVSYYFTDTNKLKLTNSHNITVEYFDASNNSQLQHDWEKAISLDAESTLRIGSVIKGASAKDYDISSLGGRVVVDRVVRAGVLADKADDHVSSWLSYQGQGVKNLLQNPSFEHGIEDWVFHYLSLAETIPSTIDTGSMLHIRDSTSSDEWFIFQPIAITSGLVGQPLTFSGWAMISSGLSSQNVLVQVSGAGVVDPSSAGAIAFAGQGWQHFSITVTPTQTGTLNVGFHLLLTGAAVNSTDVYVDMLQLTQGISGFPDPANFQELHLGGRNIVLKNDRPHSGVWKVGDIILNNAASAQGVDGWKCTVAGKSGRKWVAAASPLPWPGATRVGFPIYAEPITPNGFVYKAIDWTGDQATGNFEPAWSTIIGKQVVDNHVVWQCDSLAAQFVALGSHSGITIQRPPLSPWDAGFIYWDTTINNLVVWTGSVWESPQSYSPGETKTCTQTPTAITVRDGIITAITCK